MFSCYVDILNILQACIVGTIDLVDPHMMSIFLAGIRGIVRLKL